MAHKIFNCQSPEEIVTQMPKNTSGNRIQEQNKFATKPKWLNKSKLNRTSPRSRLYEYNTLPSQQEYLTQINKKIKNKKTPIRKKETRYDRLNCVTLVIRDDQQNDKKSKSTMSC